MEALADSSMTKHLEHKYGSKKGMLRFLTYQAVMNLGLYRQFRVGNLDQDQRLVFVCMGNICRSPLAEVYARKLGRVAASCGIECESGYPADDRAIKFARRLELNLENHRTKNVRDFEFAENDIIIGMEPRHLRLIKELNINVSRLGLIGCWHPQSIAYIHDPFNCSIQYFNRCESIIIDSVKGMICES
ncbi:low molecular weight phosphatase family protein [Marinobacter pelagius]|uniref:arsenate-mycothiol transferase ArsC n=1 Tax=Marinobacter sp. C7 TaxID=2951363 RepID=UPI001EF0D4E9|nr:low molecular weight phosphatase family protein [Marinobacter sp. C7]MCG7199468.1 low molecular weight phosphatase family protein [Marinobacter sp. C7]